MKITPFSFIHCADLHLDSPFECIQSVAPNTASVLRDATFRSFENVIDLAIQKRVDFLIVAGDVYDGADQSLYAKLRFYQALRRATESGVQCFVAHGNHDPWEAEREIPDGVYRFGSEEVEWGIAKREDEELAYVYGISYPSREVNENLATRFSREDDAQFGIGVLHCNVGGAPGHDNYAPCILDDLIACGMDYWALGHIHTRNVLRESEPCVIYSGNTQGRSVRELGERGCYLVDVDKTGHVETEFVATDVVRWFEEEVSITDLETPEILMDTLQERCEKVRLHADGRAAMLRIYLTGRGDLHTALGYQGVADIVTLLQGNEQDTRDFVWVESVQDQTRRAIDIPQRRQAEDFVGEFLKAAEELRTMQDAASEIRELLSKPREHSVIAEQLEQLKDEDLLAILDDAEAMGLDWLLKGEE